jgi:1-acyl-sn-glycerol-3-phosphate acyltransferase
MPKLPPLPAELSVDRRRFERHMADFTFAKWLVPTLHNADRIPDSGCLLVGNHGALGMDAGLLAHAVYRDTGRILRPLADRIFYTNPLGRYMASMTGAVEGTPDNAHALLKAGEAVLVYPGGARETQSNTEERYQLSWEGRTGFARSGMQAQVPWIPVACVGNDDMFHQLLDREQVASTLPGRLIGRVFGQDYVPPLLMPRLAEVEIHFFFGEPIFPLPPPDGADSPDESAVVAEQQRVRQALEALLDQAREMRRRARRKG